MMDGPKRERSGKSMVFKAGPKLCWQCASYKGHRRLRAVPDMLIPPTFPPPPPRPALQGVCLA